MIAVDRMPAGVLWALLACAHAWIATSFALRASSDTDFVYDREGMIPCILMGGATGLLVVAAVAKIWSSTLFMLFPIDARLQLSAAAVLLLILPAQRALLRALPPPARLYLGHR